MEHMNEKGHKTCMKTIESFLVERNHSNNYVNVGDKTNVVFYMIHIIKETKMFRKEFYIWKFINPQEWKQDHRSI